MMVATVSVGAAACAVAAFTDVRARRVPNWLTLPTLAVALILAIPGGLAHFAVALLVAAAMVVLGLWLHSRGILGGGDVKLLVAIGTLVGYPNCIALLLYTALAGGLLSAAVALRRGQFVPYALAIAAGFAVLVLSYTYLPAVRLPL